eukprot:2015736-Amphidinium_carterae.3
MFHLGLKSHDNYCSLEAVHSSNGLIRRTSKRSPRVVVVVDAIMFAFEVRKVARQGRLRAICSCCA